MPIIDPNNRPQKPDSVVADIIRIVFVNSENTNTEDWREGWDILFEEWTLPNKIKLPKPLRICRSWLIQSLWVMEFPEADQDMQPWQWELLYETFTYPEYQRD